VPAVRCVTGWRIEQVGASRRC